MASIVVSKTSDKGSSPLTPANRLRYGVTASTLDFGSNSPGSNPGTSTKMSGWPSGSGPGLQNQSEWFDSTTRLQLPL